MTSPSVAMPAVTEERQRGILGLLVPRGRRLHPILRLDYFVRVSMYPLFFILLVVTLYPDRLTAFFWMLLVFHVILWPYIALAIAARARNQKLAEYRNLLADSVVIGCYVTACWFNLGPSAAVLLGIHSGCISIGGWRMGVLGALATGVGMLLGTLVFGAHFDPLGGHLLAQGLGVAMIFIYTTVFSWQSHGQAQRVVRVAKQLEAQSIEVQRNSALLEERTHQLELARDAAEAANASKSQFLANMSHELRTPLNAIIGYSDLLIEEAEELDAQDLVPDLDKIRSSGKHLLGLINDVLDLSKIEAGKMDLYLETFEVRPVLEAVASTVEPLIGKNGNTLRLDWDENLGTMRADITRIRQILLNLLSNASKFTERGTITLEARRHGSESGEQMSFAVRDTGVGMTEEQLGRLFQAFAQAEASTSAKYGGTGLGLAISRKFAEMMGGDIAVTSRPGSGTTFTVRLPVVVPETEPAPISLPRNVGSRLGTVLVIDDDPAMRTLMERILGKEGFRVITAPDGPTGLELARREQPVVITLDLLMPGMDGWTVLGALKAQEDLAHIPVIMLTILDEQRIGFALGAAEYLTKPIERDRLVAVLRRYSRNPGLPVLVVEDDSATRAVLGRALSGEGRVVREAENGRVALDYLKRETPGLILLDLMMPEMDGFELLAALRERPEWEKIPVVVITAKDLTAEDHARLNGAVQQIVPKNSGDPQVLLDYVLDLVSSSALEVPEMPLTGV
jgi:signal transduction histidine kinase/CheY-like chemotaxis protein